MAELACAEHDLAAMKGATAGEPACGGRAVTDFRTGLACTGCAAPCEGRAAIDAGRGEGRSLADAHEYEQAYGQCEQGDEITLDDWHDDSS